MDKRLLLFVVSLVMFMEAIDTNIINTAIPAMSRSFNINPIDLKIALISYLISLAVFIPISGWLADKLGIKPVFIFAITLFTLSSVYCGFTESLWQLILGRIIQGLGGSLTVPIARLIIIRTYLRHELIAKMSLVVMVSSLGLMLGPVLGGIITSHSSWRWIFWVNAPVGLLASCLAYYLLPVIPAKPVHRLDKLGFILFGSGLALLTLGLSLLSESTLSIIDAMMLIFLAMVLLLGYFWHSHTHINSIVNMSLLGIRTFRIAVLGNLLARFGFGGVPFLLPLLFQMTLGWSAQQSGLLLAPIACGILLVKPISFYILQFFGYRPFLMVNTVLVCLALLAFTCIDNHTAILSIVFLTFNYGFLIALQYTAMGSLAYANIKEHNMSAATSIMSTVQQLAQSFGVAISALILTVCSTYFENNIPLTLSAFHQTFRVLAVLTLLSVFIFTHLHHNDGHELLDKPEF